MKIADKQELQQIIFNHSIDYQNVMNLYKKFTAKPYLLLVIDTTFALDNPWYFRKNLSERIQKLIVTNDDKISHKKLQYDINREAVKLSSLSSGIIDKYEYLTSKTILPFNQSRIIEEAKFIYSPLGKGFEKQMKTTEDQGEKQIKALEENRKQLVTSSGEKESLTLLKQREIFEELVNDGEIQSLIKHINFNNLIYHFKGESGPKRFISF